MWRHRPHDGDHASSPLEQAPREYTMFRNKEDNCEKIVLKPH